MMRDANVVAVSPATVYRVLRAAGVLDRWNRLPSKKGTGFVQPTAPHEHWHIDISYVNIAGTFNVLEACVKHKVKKLIYSSSASVYGDAAEVPMTESHPFNNRNFYGATKIAGEAMSTAFHDRYGLDVIGLRYMNVYGPGQDQHAVYSGVVPIMLNKISAG